jgi:cold shock protein
LASGTVKWFDEENGYGFIRADEDGRDLFVHRGSIVGDWRTRTLSEGIRVGFEPREGGIGPEAIHVPAPLVEGTSVTVSSPPAISSEFRCAACGYGIIVSGALPTCPMCRATSWESMRHQSGRSGNDARHDTRKG